MTRLFLFVITHCCNELLWKADFFWYYILMEEFLATTNPPTWLNLEHAKEIIINLFTIGNEAKQQVCSERYSLLSSWRGTKKSTARVACVWCSAPWVANEWCMALSSFYACLLSRQQILNEYISQQKFDWRLIISIWNFIFPTTKVISCTCASIS